GTVRTRVDGLVARRGGGVAPADVGGASGADGVLPPLRLLGGGHRARLAVAVSARLRRDQLPLLGDRAATAGLAGQPPHGARRRNDRVGVGAARLPDDRVPGRAA